MKKQLKEPNNLIVKDEDPANQLGLYDIAKAKTREELKSAIDKGVASFDESFGFYKFERLQESVKQFLENPGDQALHEQLIKDFDLIRTATVIEKGKYAQSSVHSMDKEYVVKLREQLIREYKASSMSKMLVIDMAINAYFRSLRASVICINLIQNKDGIVLTPEQNRTNLIKELNKQIEMANRQFMTALTFLKELKQPKINVRVHAKEAFVAQNQQFNKKA